MGDVIECPMFLCLISHPSDLIRWFPPYSFDNSISVLLLAAVHLLMGLYALQSKCWDLEWVVRPDMSNVPVFNWPSERLDLLLSPPLFREFNPPPSLNSSSSPHVSASSPIQPLDLKMDAAAQHFSPISTARPSRRLLPLLFPLFFCDTIHIVPHLICGSVAAGPYWLPLLQRL